MLNKRSNLITKGLTAFSLGLTFRLSLGLVLLAIALIGINYQTAKADTGITQIGQIGGFDSPAMREPNDVTLDSTGNIYVADTSNHRIQKLAPDGSFIAKWGANGGDGTSGTGNAEFRNPYGIALDSSGNIYVADSDNNRIQKLAPDGSFIAKWGANGGDGSYGTGNAEFRNPGGIALDSAGNIYVADTSNHRIQKLAPDGSFIAKWGKNNGDGTWGSGDAEFRYPSGIALDSAGNIYVADSENNRIQKLAPDGSFIAKWGKNNGDGSSGSGNAEFGIPNGLALDSTGNIYVADTQGYRIQKLAPDGSYLTHYPTGYPIFSYGLALDTNYNVYSPQIEGYKPGNTLKFSATGELTSYWPSEDGFMAVASVASNDALYTVLTTEDFSTAKLVKTSLDGTPITEWALPSVDASLSLDSAGNLYYFDLSNSKVIRYSSTGTVLAEYGTAGSGDGQIGAGCDGGGFMACKIAIDSTGNIYIADIIGTDDSAHTRLQKFSSSFDFLGKWEAPDENMATGLAVSPSGKVYLNFTNESGSRLQKLSSDMSPLSQYTPTGEQAYASYASLVATANGRIYISDVMSQRINILCDNDESSNGCTLPADDDSGNGNGNNGTSNTTNLTTPTSPISAFSLRPVSISTPTGTNISSSSTVPESSLVTQDPNNQYPLGLVNFSFTTNQSSNQVVLTFITNLTPNQVTPKKYNPSTNTYTNLPTSANAVVTETTIDGKHALVLTYTIIDNGELDLDPTAGTISDPVGLAVSNSTYDQLANTGDNVYFFQLLAGILAALGIGITSTVVLRGRNSRQLL